MTTPSEKLLLVMRYLTEAGDDAEEAAQHADPYRRTARRQAIRENLQAARELLALLESEHPGVTVPYTIETGEEITVTVPFARINAYRVEAFVMFRCYEDYAATRDLMERAIAVDPEIAFCHAMLAGACAELRDYPAAIAAIERAISLDPDDMDYKRGLNDARREQERYEAEQAAAKRPRWNLKSWLT